MLFKKLGFLEPEKRTRKSASECGWVRRRISADTNVSLQAKIKKCRSVEFTNAPRTHHDASTQKKMEGLPALAKEFGYPSANKLFEAAQRAGVKVTL